MDVQSAELYGTLLSGRCLTVSTAASATTDLKTLLVSRLANYYRELGRQSAIPALDSLEEAQRETAEQALHVVERVHSILRADSTQLIGARDLAVLRTLLSIVLNWKCDPLLLQIFAAWPSTLSPAGFQHSSIATIPQEYKQLSLTARRLSGLVDLDSADNRPQTTVTTTLLQLHLPEVLKLFIALGWLPERVTSESTLTEDEFRPLLTRFLSTLSASETIVALGSILSGNSNIPPHFKKTCGVLLSQQLLRPDGVAGLCAAVFRDDEVGESASLDGLEHVSRVLCSVPSGMNPRAYYEIIVPRLLALLSRAVPPVHKRAVSFALSRLLASGKTSSRHAIVSSILLPLLHNPLLGRACVTTAQNHTASTLSSSTESRAIHDSSDPRATVLTLQVLLTNIDPSPLLISTILSPIAPPLYTLWSRLERAKTSDPAFKESVKGLLSTWGRVVSMQDAVNKLWGIVCGEGGEWDVDAASGIHKAECLSDTQPLILLTPEDLLQADDDGGLDPNSNLLDLRPDPIHFVRVVVSMGRPDISSELFVKLLEAYYEVKSQTDGDPMRSLLLLQLIIQMQSQTTKASNFLRTPRHIFSLIKHMLESSTSPQAKMLHPPPSAKGTLTLEDLRIAPESEEHDLDNIDSDDEEGDAAVSSSPDEEMLETAINLLLAILEANEDISSNTVPELADIMKLLEPIAEEPQCKLRPLAREARMVLTARSASASTWNPAKPQVGGVEDNPLQVYQKALKLLQDPILPVRAHGLLLLRQLVSARTGQSSFLEPALVPGILSIFLQSLEDDDSYIFLNAIQGLAAMVDSFGKSVLTGLIDMYASGLDGSGGFNLTQHDIDKRTRIGEALGQIIRKMGETLSLYVDTLVPPLFHIIRASHVSANLRVSAISLLADCEKAHSLSLIAYTEALFEGMIDLLQVESVPRSSGRDTQSQSDATRGEKNSESEATSTDSKLPQLRRAALHFIAISVRGLIARVHDGYDLPREIQKVTIGRAASTLSYIALVDEDAIVRLMARETRELLDDLGRAFLGP